MPCKAFLDFWLEFEVNKNFLECLVEVKSGLPPALIWLKRTIDFEVCETMLSDWEYSGKLKIYQFVQIILKEKLEAKKKIKILGSSFSVMKPYFFLECSTIIFKV